MIRILFVVSTLQRTGPTNQLLNIVTNLDSEAHEIFVLTLSKEPDDSMIDEFTGADISLVSLGLSRLQSMLYGRSALSERIAQINPDVIHTQGIRADGFLARLNKYQGQWLSTARNFPWEDYPSKFGRAKGYFMAFMHIRAYKKCRNLVSCSVAISDKLNSVKLTSSVVQNGVRKGRDSIGDKPVEFKEMASPILICVGSLIKRKNVLYLGEAFNRLPLENRGSLVFLGDGPEREELENLDDSDIYCLGKVSNVNDYLDHSDYFVSTSLSEGLPNTVLEALSRGVPALLSDIPPHEEIYQESDGSVQLFQLDDGFASICETLSDLNANPDDKLKSDAVRLATEVFSAERMALQYGTIYEQIVKRSR